MNRLNSTHDVNIKSWVASANEHGSEFPIQNLPFAVFRRKGSSENFRGGVAIGDQVIDLAALASKAALPHVQEQLDACSQPKLNQFMAMGHHAWSALRAALFDALTDGFAHKDTLQSCLIAQQEIEFDVPADIGDYTDFYSSIHHATNVGKLFRPDNPLLPNYQWVPIGYHGRSSSIGVSGQQFHRPKGQLKAPDQEHPRVGECQRLDYELEVGIYVGKGNDLGQPIALDDAEQHIFGLCLFNDWSARDIQAWEYQPLGPFLSKSFASTVSPWIVTMEALAPFRQAWQRAADHPQPLDYLESEQNRQQGAIDLQLEVLIQSQKMKNEQIAPALIAKSGFADSYWSVAQMVAHHSSNGCNLRPGDLLGSGTQSGAQMNQVGSLLESTLGGKQPIDLGNGEQRLFLQDGDSVVLRGRCEREGFRSIGFGEAQGTVLPAR